MSTLKQSSPDLHSRFSGRQYMCSKYYRHSERDQPALVLSGVILAAAGVWFVTAFSYPISTVANTFQCHLHIALASSQHATPLVWIVQQLLSR